MSALYFNSRSTKRRRAQEFAQGGPLYGQQLTGKELRERFGQDK
jgi:hypothetical protein